LTTNSTFYILHSYLGQRACKTMNSLSTAPPQHLQNQTKHSKIMHNKPPLTYQR